MANEHIVTYSYPKKEKLRLKKECGELFAHGISFVSFPFRITLSVRPKEKVPVKSLVITRKKLFRHAVDRVLARRRFRESFRLQKHILEEYAEEKDCTFFVAFMYISEKIESHEWMMSKMETVVTKIMSKADDLFENSNTDTSQNSVL